MKRSCCPKCCAAVAEIGQDLDQVFEKFVVQFMCHVDFLWLNWIQSMLFAAMGLATRATITLHTEPANSRQPSAAMTAAPDAIIRPNARTASVWWLG